MTEAEAFLKKNAGYCEPLRMWLTPEGCAAIRNRKSGVWDYEAGMTGPPVQCMSCAGVEAQPEAYQIPVSIKPSGSDIMTMQTYTVAELAALIGVTRKDIDNTKRSRTVSPVAGSGVDKVRTYMREHGIEWHMVVPAVKGRPGGSRKSDPASPPTAEAKVMAAIELPETPEPSPIPSLEHEKAVADLFADDWKPEDAPAPVSALTSLDDVLRELRARLPMGAKITIEM